MSQDVLVALVREVAADYSAQRRLEALPDAALAELGLDEAEIRSIRDGFFDRVLRLGVLSADAAGAGGCCA